MSEGIDVDGGEEKDGIDKDKDKVESYWHEFSVPDVVAEQAEQKKGEYLGDCY